MSDSKIPPIFFPTNICKNTDDNITCFENLSLKNCDDIKKDINTFLGSKDNPGKDLETFKNNVKSTDIQEFLSITSSKVNTVFKNMSCLIDGINNNTALGLTNDEKIEPVDETKLKYNFIKDIIGNNKELKNKIFDNLGGNILKIINITNIIFFICFSIIISFLLMKK